MQYSVDAFAYDCPRHLIAQHPLPDRDASRLLVLNPPGTIEHRTFRDLPSLVRPGDLFVINTSRVIRARLTGLRDNGREAEILLVHPNADGTWLAMVHPGGKLKPGRSVLFEPNTRVRIEEMLGGGLRRISVSGGLNWNGLMERFGDVPLPPYIDRESEAEDAQRYQTVFAKQDGSVAAPTAGLHFTKHVLADIEAHGARICETVLHVGPGTFKPVQVDDIRRHVMHREWFELPEKTAKAMIETKQAGGRVWAVGTTVARVLETLPDDVPVESRSGWTDIFIYPPYTFRFVDCLVTNFHLPRSTLLMLACAFGGYEPVMTAYRQAIRQGYRLFSYGDAMVITT